MNYRSKLADLIYLKGCAKRQNMECTIQTNECVCSKLNLQFAIRNM